VGGVESGIKTNSLQKIKDHYPNRFAVFANVDFMEVRQSWLSDEGVLRNW